MKPLTEICEQINTSVRRVQEYLIKEFIRLTIEINKCDGNIQRATENKIELLPFLINLRDINNERYKVYKAMTKFLEVERLEVLIGFIQGTCLCKPIDKAEKLLEFMQSEGYIIIDDRKGLFLISDYNMAM